MARVNVVKLKFVYEDSTSRTYTFNGVADENLSAVKAKVILMNDNLAHSTSYTVGAALSNTFVSDAGSKLKMITEARLISTEQEVIYNAN